ncbi:hypothetical protein [Chitinophaga arvensicola]|uniref:Uncharacterized protein n=1 Tax=Chitinophaga arvensicola TaxID=29529 RepID=A0A1I0QEG5_9BACT|nr:hypothetical protein [Chitinophaga arvensicola]SEW25307.1 hypothetical protein SAMN04488122_1407 [Chitinophaga arvensicola]
MDPLKAAWDATPAPHRTITDLQGIIRKHTSPVLKRIRTQMIIEAIGYVAFLLVYYDFFDGDKKPFYLNALLVFSVACMLANNVIGYRMATHPGEENNLLDHMRQKLRAIRIYAAWAICTKVLGFAGVMTFLLAGIQWNGSKYATLFALALIMAMQVYANWKIWRGRIKHIRQTVEELSR